MKSLNNYIHSRTIVSESIFDPVSDDDIRDEILARTLDPNKFKYEIQGDKLVIDSSKKRTLFITDKFLRAVNSAYPNVREINHDYIAQLNGVDNVRDYIDCISAGMLYITDSAQLDGTTFKAHHVTITDSPVININVGAEYGVLINSDFDYPGTLDLDGFTNINPELTVTVQGFKKIRTRARVNGIKDIVLYDPRGKELAINTYKKTPLLDVVQGKVPYLYTIKSMDKAVFSNLDPLKLYHMEGFKGITRIRHIIDNDMGIQMGYARQGTEANYIDRHWPSFKCKNGWTVYFTC